MRRGELTLRDSTVESRLIAIQMGDLTVKRRTQSLFNQGAPQARRLRPERDQPVLEPLVIALEVVVLDELGDGETEVPFTERIPPKAPPRGLRVILSAPIVAPLFGRRLIYLRA
jgi:hypothetical protein